MSAILGGGVKWSPPVRDPHKSHVPYYDSHCIKKSARVRSFRWKHSEQVHRFGGRGCHSLGRWSDSSSLTSCHMSPPQPCHRFIIQKHFYPTGRYKHPHWLARPPDPSHDPSPAPHNSAIVHHAVLDETRCQAHDVHRKACRGTSLGHGQYCLVSPIPGTNHRRLHLEQSKIPKLKRGTPPITDIEVWCRSRWLKKTPCRRGSVVSSPLTCNGFYVGVWKMQQEDYDYLTCIHNGGGGV